MATSKISSWVLITIATSLQKIITPKLLSTKYLPRIKRLQEQMTIMVHSKVSSSYPQRPILEATILKSWIRMVKIWRF